VTDDRTRPLEPGTPTPGSGPVRPSLRGHDDAVRAICRGRLRSLVDAEDALGRVADRADAVLAEIDDPARIRRRLVRLAESTCIEMIRRGARPAVAVGSDADSRPASGSRPDADVLRQTLAALGERERAARVLQAALTARQASRDPDVRVPSAVPAAAVVPVGPPKRAALVKVASVGGLLPAVIAPTVALATALVLVLPGVGEPPDPPALDATAAPATTPTVRPSALSTAPVPATTAPRVTAEGLGTPAISSTPASSVGSQTTTTNSPSEPSRSIVVGDDRTGRVGVTDEDPGDDDVTVGDDEVLGLGASIEETAERLGLPPPPEDSRPLVLDPSQ
jgi:DNA-directed RNA polymerase specialized sigma24 family protein